MGVVVPEGKLIPKDEESFNHTARVCRVGPDNKLYIQLGQPFNVPPKDKLDLYRKSASAASSAWTRTARTARSTPVGMRNSVGMDFNPKDKTLWFTDNQVDGMGDDIPPGELNHVTKMGQNFGFPWYGGGHVAAPRVQGPEAAGRRRLPRGRAGRARGRPRHDVLHRQDVPGQVPGRHLLDAARLVEPHGAGRRARDGDLPEGRRPCRRPVDSRSPKAGTTAATTWAVRSTSPQSWDGSLLVSDDLVGAIYRIWYDGK